MMPVVVGVVRANDNYELSRKKIYPVSLSILGVVVFAVVVVVAVVIHVRTAAGGGSH